jgi:hypothetical protein
MIVMVMISEIERISGTFYRQRVSIYIGGNAVSLLESDNLPKGSDKWHFPRPQTDPCLSNSQAPIGFEDHINQWADMSYKLISDGFTSLGLTAKASKDDIG